LTQNLNLIKKTDFHLVVSEIYAVIVFVVIVI